MAEPSKDKRAVFSRGKQRAFLEQVNERITIVEMARISHRSERTIRDWRREKFSMPLAAVKTLSTRTNVPFPKGIKVEDAYAHNVRASKMGIAAVIKKYGRIPHNEEHRKKQWRAWWESTGRFERNPILDTKAVYKPRRSWELSEFIGIMMGDGGISAYQATITLHHEDDQEYTSFVTKLIRRLFKITPSVYHLPKKSVNNIVVSRKELVEYLHALGLPVGNKVKQQFDIPEWIKRNQKFSIACLRGLIDTDGSIFTHRYKAKGKLYSYKKLSFTSASTPLLQSVHNLLRELGFHPRLGTRDVRLENTADMRLYFSIVGSHNPKHLRRYENTVG